MDAFIVVSESYATSFQRQVNTAINKGYVLMGIPTVDTKGNFVAFLTKKDNLYVTTRD